MIERNDSGEHKVKQVKLENWNHVRKIWRETRLEEASWLGAVALEAPSKGHLGTSHLCVLETMDGHMGHISLNQQNALEQGREKRNSHRGLILMTLGDEGEPIKKTMTPLCSFKTNLNLFFPE